MTERYCSMRLLVAVLVSIFAAPALADSFGTDGNQFNIDFVTISGSTNPTSGYGIVNNNYRMGRHSKGDILRGRSSFILLHYK